MEKVENYINKVGYSERNPSTAVEPRLCMQWFLSMQHFADIALPPVMNDELKFYPSKYKTTYRNWLENIQDWCISRQLWWGHRIPAYFLPVGEGGEERGANRGRVDRRLVCPFREEPFATSERASLNVETVFARDKTRADKAMARLEKSDERGGRKRLHKRADLAAGHRCLGAQMKGQAAEALALI